MTEDSAAEPTISRKIAEFAHELSLADVPIEVRDQAKRHLLDALGIAIASSGMDFGRAVHAAAVRLGHSDESRVLGFGTTLPAASAALANGTLIHGLDFDDTHVEAIHHATAPALAAALAVGEAEHADGASTLKAYITGLEVGCRLAAFADGGFHDRGFHPTAILGAFAAACVTATLRSLPPETLVNALGLCGSQAAGILEIRESWLKRFHPGWAAHAGIVSATLAEEGFRGPATVFEGPQGLYASHLGRVPDAVALGLGDLGTRWFVRGIALKPYPCCHFLHAFVDAALDLRTQMEFPPEEIERIECPISERLAPLVTEPVDRKIAPPTVYDALFSVQYMVALALVRGRVDLASCYDGPLDDPTVIAIARRVVCPPDPLSDYPRHFPGEVVLHLGNGRVLRQRIVASRGTPERPLSPQEVTAKFHANAEREMPAQRASAVVDAVTDLEKRSDVRRLVAECTTGSDKRR